MKNTTLVYIEKDGKYLMLHRTKKQQDPNANKWIGVGGHFEENETPVECALREVKEETNLILTEYRFRGIVTFISDKYETEYMHLFTATEFTGELSECDEGELKWIDKGEILNLNLWEGDKVFLKYLLDDEDAFFLKLEYEGDKLVKCTRELS
ncbi:MAG: 8-oxo-dGTP diphosphatase [Lachnospiraceae bacterium]|nr:8-oxo-dGTP diphosphatase [Lachnospiraceae bacterium]